MGNTVFSVDVEQDLHSKSYLGITSGLSKFEKLCDKYEIKPVLFVTADCVKKYPLLFKKLNKKGWEISLHGFTHDRFDEMSAQRKEKEIKDSISCWKKNLNIKIKGFRAPQHSIDAGTLDLLERYGFKYDSSYTPLNLLQLFFFPKKLKIWARSFFSPLNPYKIRADLIETPTSSLLVPYVSLVLRAFPKPLIYLYVKTIHLFYKNPIFYAHSWDFIELKDSRIDRTFSHTKLLSNLEYVMSIENGK